MVNEYLPIALFLSNNHPEMYCSLQRNLFMYSRFQDGCLREIGQ